MKVLGHRGIRQADPEKPYQNSLGAIFYALKAGADGVEIDVMKSKDDEIFVIHDDDVSLHSKKDKGLISKLNAEDIRKVRVGDWYKIPSLNEVLDIFERKFPSAILNIELKGDNTAKDTLRTIKVRNFNIDKILFSSFKYDELRIIRKVEKKAKIGLLIAEDMLKGESAEDFLSPVIKELKPNALCVQDKLLTKNLIKLGIEIYVWGLGSDEIPTEKLKYYFDNDINIITDYPERIV
jgi:glycerophosphoryl diester phosphodiesterase